MQFAKYLKTAFLNRWNLLAFLGSAAFAMISGQPDVLLPIILAGEVAYVGLLGSHPKFQKYVDAHEAQSLRSESVQANERTLQQIMRSLPRESLDRFDALRRQCAELRQIALDLKHPAVDGVEMPLEESQTAGLERLLWIYLRMLYTQFALNRFLKKTSEEQIRGDIARLEERLKQTPAGEPGTQAARIRSTLQQNLETCQARLANLGKARDNFQLIELQIDQLENKIRSLSEMAVNRQEPEYISSQVEQVASSMLDTERTMNELQFVTGLHPLDEQTPELLTQRTVTIHR